MLRACVLGRLFGRLGKADLGSSKVTANFGTKLRLPVRVAEILCLVLASLAKEDILHDRQGMGHNRLTSERASYPILIPVTTFRLDSQPNMGVFLW